MRFWSNLSAQRPAVFLLKTFYAESEHNLVLIVLDVWFASTVSNELQYEGVGTSVVVLRVGHVVVGGDIGSLECFIHYSLAYASHANRDHKILQWMCWC